jgi:hypothetical protein
MGVGWVLDLDGIGMSLGGSLSWNKACVSRMEWCASESLGSW